MPSFNLSAEQVKTFFKDGYLIVKNFCTQQEIDKLYTTAIEDNAMRNNALDLNDQSGKKNEAFIMVHSWK